MGVSGAVRWWDEWQLLVLVLASLAIQYFLAISSRWRKVGVPSWCRFLVWLSFLGSDALAIYALAALFNRHKDQGHESAPGSRDLEVFWAPILLMHLGGQVFITTYNLEGNELWKRHVVTGIFQVTLALYVFCKSWPSSADRRLLAAAILLFIPGIFRCLAKPWAVQSGTYSSHAHLDPIEEWAASNMGQELENYVEKARGLVLGRNSPEAASGKGGGPSSMPLLVDCTFSYSTRLENLESFLWLNNRQHNSSLKWHLSCIFDLLYTKKAVTPEPEDMDGGCACGESWNTLARSASFFCPPVAIILFHTSHKKAYSHSDVVVTYVLMYGLFVLELFSKHILKGFANQWPETVDQQSVIGYFARNKRHKLLKGTAQFLQCEDLVDQYFGMEPGDEFNYITMLVRRHVILGWQVYITDAKTYREFGDFRGQWTLERETCDQYLASSIEKPFDESVLLWHIATDFCFHHMGGSSGHNRASICRQMSNYMMHLLSANPELLMPGSRKNLFKIAYKELEGIFEGRHIPRGERQLATKLIAGCRDTEGGYFIHDAWLLAQVLMDLGSEKKIWRVIQGVWLEMLCFSASRSRGYLHAKSLGTGGEFLSYIWILLADAGLETYAERLGRAHYLPVPGSRDGGEAPSASRGKELPTEEEGAAAPSASQGTEVHSQDLTDATPYAPPGQDTLPEIQIVLEP